MKELLNGIFYMLDGFCLLIKPGIRVFVIVPVIINMTLFVLLFLASWYLMGEFNFWFAHHVPSWLQWLSVVLWVFFVISFLLISVYTFMTFANLIAAPFNSFLSEKVDLYLTRSVSTPLTLWQTLKDSPRIIGRQIGIVFYYLPRALLMLLLFIVPVVQIIAGPLWFLFHGWTMTLTYLDYPSDNQRIAMKKVRIFAGANKLLALGFGSAVLVALMLPVVNFFAIPAAVAGATKLWVEEYRQN